MTEEKQDDWWRLKILVGIAVWLLVGWLILELFAWLTPIGATPFSTINSSLTRNLTLDPSRCIDCGNIDGSYVGEYICVKGTVQAVSSGKDGTHLLFSREPHT